MFVQYPRNRNCGILRATGYRELSRHFAFEFLFVKNLSPDKIKVKECTLIFCRIYYLNQIFNFAQGNV